MIADADISEPGSPALSPKRILFQHTFQLPKRGGKEQINSPNGAAKNRNLPRGQIIALTGKGAQMESQRKKS